MAALSFADAEFLTRRTGSKRVGNNTYVERIDVDTFGIRLHSTYVVRIHRDGTYTLNASGWRTVTTKERINRYSPARVSQKDWEWYVGGSTFFDGVKVDAAGRVLNAA